MVGRMMHYRMPNTFIVGAPKCGTTTLDAALAGHQGIFMSRVKEPGHFNRDESYRNGGGNSDYLRAFFRPGLAQARIGESTPWYLYSDRALTRISSDCEDVRIVVLVRDPVARSWSQYCDQAATGAETRQFLAAVEDEVGGNTAGYSIKQLYLESSRYAKYIERWVGTFGSDRVLVLTMEALRASPNEALGIVWGFLGLEHSDHVQVGTKNRGGQLKSQVLAGAISTREHPGLIRRVARSTLPTRLRYSTAQRISDWNKTSVGSAQLDSAAREILAQYLGGERRLLERAMKRPLQEWD